MSKKKIKCCNGKQEMNSLFVFEHKAIEKIDNLI